MTQHVSYTKMENNNAKNLSALDKTHQYVLTEKIHGTNSSCYVTFDSEGEYTIQHGKRTALVGKGEKFYNIQQVLKPYEHSMVECAKHVLYEIGHAHFDKTVIFFGEIYGGHYNNSKSPGSMMVQKWMDYAPGNHFAGFDIVVKLSEDTEPFPISYTKFKEAMETYNIPTVPEVMRGSLEELMKNYNPNKAISIVSKVLHNLNNVEKPECEGAVLRPLNSNDFENRLKWKAAKYCDRPRSNKEKKKNESLFYSYCNSNRIDSVKSHYGNLFFQYDDKTKGPVEKVMNDILVDFRMDYKNEITEVILGDLKNKVIDSLREWVLDYVITFNDIIEIFKENKHKKLPPNEVNKYNHNYFLEPKHFGYVLKQVNDDVMFKIDKLYPGIFKIFDNKKILMKEFSKKVLPLLKKFINEWLPDDAPLEDRILRQEMRSKETSLDISSLRMKLDSINNRINTLSG